MSADIAFLDATRLAELIRNREMSSVEVVQAHLDRIDAINPKINAVVTVAEAALQQAREADTALRSGKEPGPLHGVPFTVKDHFDTAGVAIREGVYKSLEITAEHFLDDYKKRARFFIYNSKQLHNLESFSSDAGINVMVINVQAFNATGKDARRIYEELDDFQSRRPIDVISANRPIMFLDEPQKMEGGKTLDSLANFKPLAVLRYSATHKTAHNKIHRLDALDAYNQKLVKKIAVRGISVKSLTGTNAYGKLMELVT